MSDAPVLRDPQSRTADVERIYSSLARVYDRCFDWALRPGRLAAVACLPPEACSILEVGVGTGLSLASYRAAACITGIDISAAMLARARLQSEALPQRSIEIRRMDAQAMEFPDASFDAVLVPYVVSVVPEPRRVMAEVARVCRPGGSVIVVNHFIHRGSPLRLLERLGSPLTERIGFRLDTTLEVVTQASGFSVVSVTPVNIFGWWKLIELRRA